MFDMKVKTLLAVIEAGSYTKAAQKLNPNSPEAQNLSRRELRQLAKMQKEIESR